MSGITSTSQAQAQLNLLGYVPGDVVHYRAFLPHTPGQKSNDKGRKTSAAFGQLPDVLQQWQAEGRGIYAVVNKGGAAIADITECVALFYEHDNLDKGLSAILWKSLGLPEPTFQVDTGGKSIHSYWALEQFVEPLAWRELQTQLLEHADADRSLKNQNRVMRLAGFKHPGSGEVSQLIECSGQRYSYETMRKAIPEPKPAVVQQTLKTTPATSYDDDRTFARKLLRHIPVRQPGSGTYEESFRVLAALVHKFGQHEGLQLAREWSPDHDWGEDLERKVKGLRGGSRPVTFGSLVAIARQNGWAPEPKDPQVTEWRTEEPRPETVREIEQQVEQQGVVSEVEQKYQAFRKDLMLALQIPDHAKKQFVIDEIAIRYRKNRQFMKTVLDELEQRRKTEDSGEKTEFDVTDLLNEATSLTRYLIEDWIPIGESILLSAKPKTGKTLLGYDAAYAVATGGQFLGKRAKKGKVLIIQTEEGRHELRKRLDTRGFYEVEPGQVRIWTRFKCHRDIAKLESFLAEFRPDLVVLDSLRRTATGSGVSENDAAFSQFVYDLSDATRAYNSSLIIIDHDKKTGEAQGIDNVSGSLAKVGGVWGSWRLIRMSQDENNPSRQLACVIRGGVSSRHVIRFEEGEGCSWEWKWEQEMGADPEIHSHEQRILKILNANRHCELSMSQLTGCAGLEKGSRIFYRPLNRLIDKGRVVMRRDDSNRRLFWYSIPIPPADSTLPPPTTGGGVQPLAHKGSEVAQQSDQVGSNSRSMPGVTLSPREQNLEKDKRTDNRIESVNPDRPTVEQAASDQVGVQPQNNAASMVAHPNPIDRGECESRQAGYEVNGVWHYRQDVKPQPLDRHPSVCDLDKAQNTPCPHPTGSVVRVTYADDDAATIRSKMAEGYPAVGTDAVVTGAEYRKTSIFGSWYWRLTITPLDGDDSFEVLEFDVEGL